MLWRINLLHSSWRNSFKDWIGRSNTETSRTSQFGQFRRRGRFSCLFLYLLYSFHLKKTKKIVEEAIHFADCLLTPSAFRGEGVTKATVEPMFSLLGEEGFEPMSMMTDDEVWSQEETAETAAHIVNHAAVTWEKYFVAPPGNKSIHPELDRSENEPETEKWRHPSQTYTYFSQYYKSLE